MPVQTIEKVINDHQVKIVQFYGVRGFKIKAKLYKLVLPLLTTVLGSGGLNQEIDSSKLTGLFNSLDPDHLFTLLLELLSGVFVDGQMVDQKKFDELFIANYKFAYQLAFEVIQANGFFDFGDIGNLVKSQLNQISPKN